MSLSKMNAFGNNSNKATSLGMSKDRGKKVMITDEAIKKVPYIKYRGVPEYQYDTIQQLAKNVLKIAQKENDSNEVTITYSYDPKILAENNELFGVYHGKEHSVDLMADPLTFHLIMNSSECAVISLHNHPSLSLISLMDTQFFLYYQSIKLLVVVTNLGSISYLAKSDKFKFQESLVLINKAIEMHNKATNLAGYQEAAKFFLKNCYKVGIIYDNK